MTGETLRKLGRFSIVGLGATALYAVLGLILARAAGLPPLEASALAYAGAALISYAGHRRLTFRSDRAHATALPRFLAINGVGFAIAIGCAFVCERARLPVEVAFVATCVIVPLLNFLLLDRLVFPARRASHGSPE